MKLVAALAVVLLSGVASPVWAEQPSMGDPVIATGDHPGRPQVPSAAFAGKSLVVTWVKPYVGVAGRLLDQDHQATTDELLLVASDPLPPIPFRAVLRDHRSPAVAGLDDGGFLLVWVEQRVDLDVFPFREERVVLEGAVVAQRFDHRAQPLGPRHRVGLELAAKEELPAITRAAGDELLVAWERRDGIGSGIWMRRLASSGAPLGGAVHLDPAGAMPSVATLDDGTALIAWHRCCDGAEDLGIFGQVVDSDGELVGPVFQLNTTESWNQGRVSVVAVSDSFLATWQSPLAENPASAEIRGQAISDEGTFLGRELVVSSGWGTSHSSPQAAALPGGPILVTWLTWLDWRPVALTGVLLDARGRRLNDPFHLSRGPLAGQFSTSLQAGSESDFVASWIGYDDRSQLAILSRVVFSDALGRQDRCQAPLLRSFGLATRPAAICR